MPVLPSIYTQFNNLNLLNPSNILAQLKFSLPVSSVENYIANRILYPQAIPSSKQDMQIELAILSEIVRINNVFFYNHSLSKITIPEDFNYFYKSIDDLIIAVLLGLNYSGLCQIILKNPDLSILTGSTLCYTTQSHQSTQQIAINSKPQTQKIPSIAKYGEFSDDITVTIDQFSAKTDGGQLGFWVKLI